MQLKVVEYKQGMQIPTVYLRKTNTCSLKQNDDQITEAIQEDVYTGPTGIVRRKLMRAVQQQGEGVHLAKKLDDKPRMKQVKQGMVAFQNLENQSFETVGEVKTTANT